MLRVRRSGPRLALRGPWSGGLAPVQFATAPSFNGRVLAGRSLAGFRQAPLTRPMDPEPRCLARFDQLLMIN